MSRDCGKCGDDDQHRAYLGEGDCQDTGHPPPFQFLGQQDVAGHKLALRHEAGASLLALI